MRRWLCCFWVSFFVIGFGIFSLAANKPLLKESKSYECLLKPLNPSTDSIKILRSRVDLYRNLMVETFDETWLKDGHNIHETVHNASLESDVSASHYSPLLGKESDEHTLTIVKFISERGQLRSYPIRKKEDFFYYQLEGMPVSPSFKKSIIDFISDLSEPLGRTQTLSVQDIYENSHIYADVVDRVRKILKSKEISMYHTGWFGKEVEATLKAARCALADTDMHDKSSLLVCGRWARLAYGYVAFAKNYSFLPSVEVPNTKEWQEEFKASALRGVAISEEESLNDRDINVRLFPFSKIYTKIHEKHYAHNMRGLQWVLTDKIGGMLFLPPYRLYAHEYEYPDSITQKEYIKLEEGIDDLGRTIWNTIRVPFSMHLSIVLNPTIWDKLVAHGKDKKFLKLYWKALQADLKR